METEKLDLSLVEAKYGLKIIGGFNPVSPVTNIAVKNDDVGMIMFIYSYGIIRFRSTIERDNKVGYESFFEEFDLKENPTKYFISAVVEWFCELSFFPNHLEKYRKLRHQLE